MYAIFLKLVIKIALLSSSGEPCDPIPILDLQLVLKLYLFRHKYVVNLISFLLSCDKFFCVRTKDYIEMNVKNLPALSQKRVNV